MRNRTVITGWGAVTPYGKKNIDYQENFYKNIAYKSESDWTLSQIGEVPVGKIEEIRIDGFPFHFSPPFPNRLTLIGMMAVVNCLIDAKCFNQREIIEKFGVIVNSTLGPSYSIQLFLEKLYKKGPEYLSPILFSKSTSNISLGDISRILKLKGPGAITYGENSICYGLDLIENGHANSFLCGGFDEITDLNILLSKYFNRLCSLERINNGEDYQNMILSEVSSFLLIENLEFAIERKAKIYYEIVDYISYQDHLSNHDIFKKDKNKLHKNLQKILINNNVDNSETILYSGAACLPWQVKNYEWNVLSKLNYDFIYTNSKPSLGEGYSGSPAITIINSILAKERGKLANVFLEKSPYLRSVPKNIHCNLKKGFTYVINHSFSLGGNNTIILLKNITQ